MIQANELRIGNLFKDKYSNEYIKVLELTTNAIVFDYLTNKNWQAEPIPLTEEILLTKTPFKRIDHNHFLYKSYCIWVLDGRFYYDKNGEQIKYVHDLQNSFFL